MRKQIVAGNWKMNGSVSANDALIKGVLTALPNIPDHCTVIVAPPMPYIATVGERLGDQKKVALAAQNCHCEKSGAFTGEVSAEMLKDAGCNWVILGHSERREYFAEDDALLAKKVDAALAAGLKVIFCCGEPLEIREKETQNDFVASQLKGALSRLDGEAMSNVVIAYEPIWAIGTGRTATAGQAQDMHAHIRTVLADLFGPEVAQNTPILYGGSAKPTNAAELFAGADVDGGLIGGASLKASEFVGIVEAMIKK